MSAPFWYRACSAMATVFACSTSITSAPMYSIRVKDNSDLEQIKGDIRDQALLGCCLKGCDAVIHLACISNDPSFELNPELGRSINFDAFEPLVRLSTDSGVRRFIYASSSSVYGVSEVPKVTEEHPLLPLTDYSKYKALCEPILLDRQAKDFTTVIIRPATVCGYSPRQRLDLTVNILTTHAVHNGRITVFGGSQIRPNIHVDDLADLYVQLLQLPDDKIAGQTFNAGYRNHTVTQLAERVREVVHQEVPGREDLQIVTTPTDDQRSYHISSERSPPRVGLSTAADHPGRRPRPGRCFPWGEHPQCDERATVL